MDDSIPASDPTLVRILEESQQQAKDMAAVLEKQTAALERITANQTVAINDSTKAGIKSSEDLAKDLETLGKSSSNIKPTQPHFFPREPLRITSSIKSLLRLSNSLLKEFLSWVKK